MIDERESYFQEFLSARLSGFVHFGSRILGGQEASLCGQEIVYIRAILRDFGLSQSHPTPVYEDNLAYIPMSINPVHVESIRVT